MESQNSQTELKHNQARNEAAQAPSKPIRILSIIQGHFSQVRHQTSTSAKVLLASVQIQYPRSDPIPERLRRREGPLSAL